MLSWKNLIDLKRYIIKLKAINVPVSQELFYVILQNEKLRY